MNNAEIQSAFADPAVSQRFPPLLTVDQAADLVQVPRQTIYNWSSRGLLKGCSTKAGKHLRFFRDRLLRQIFDRGV